MSVDEVFSDRAWFSNAAFTCCVQEMTFRSWLVYRYSVDRWSRFLLVIGRRYGVDLRVWRSDTDWSRKVRSCVNIFSSWRVSDLNFQIVLEYSRSICIALRFHDKTFGFFWSLNELRWVCCISDMSLSKKPESSNWAPISIWIFIRSALNRRWSGVMSVIGILVTGKSEENW